MSKKPVVYSSPNELNGRLPMRLAFPFGLQHVLAMFVGNLSPLLIIMSICGITADAGMGTLRVSLLQNAMLVAGINTMIQVRKLGPIGSGLPIVMGTSSGFIGVNKAIAASMMAGVAAGTITTSATAGIYAYGAIMGAQMCGGIFEMILGFCIKPLRKFFPAVVTGTVVTAIGLSLFSVGIGFFGGGNANADYGALWNLFLGLVTLIAILIFKHGCKGFLSVSAILMGIIVGYIVSFIMGLFLPETVTIGDVTVTAAYITKWEQVKDAAWFALPKLMPVKPQFNIGAIVPLMIMFIVTAVETVGDTAGVTEGGLGREPSDKELSGSVVCDGFGSFVSAWFGSLPNTSFSQNVGLVNMTKMVNRFALTIGALILIGAGLFPKIGAIISIMPQPVLGGAAVMMFANIVISGINLLTKEPLDGRNATIVAIALGLGYGIGSTTAVQSFMPTWMTYIFGGSGIVPAAMLAIILNIVIPKDKKEA
ncbi:MAG: purine/pyrimidine permease [Oscillospiraceae bacterium]|nr:purine/pyrimidine permease [Oscillospiraceae bacterium]